MAVAGPQYEDIFCLGEHALGEAGACLIKAAGRSAGPAPDGIGAILSTQPGAYRPVSQTARPYPDRPSGY